MEYAILALQIVIAILIVGVAIWTAGTKSYVNKLMENAANHADIDKLVEQVEVITKATRAIEATVSIDTWSKQQRIDLQKTTLIEMLNALADAEHFADKLVRTFADTRDWPVEKRLDQQEEAVDKYHEAMRSFERTRLPVNIVCSSVIGEQLKVIHFLLGYMSYTLSQETWESIAKENTRNLHLAIVALEKLIRNELGFEPHTEITPLLTFTVTTPQFSESSAVPTPDPQALE